jgi:hypothetical protein
VASTFIGTECVPKPSNCAWPPGGSLSFGRIEVTAEFFLEYGEGLPVSRQHVPLMYPRTCTLWICKITNLISTLTGVLVHLHAPCDANRSHA